MHTYNPTNVMNTSKHTFISHWWHELILGQHKLIRAAGRQVSHPYYNNMHNHMHYNTYWNLLRSSTCILTSTQVYHIYAISYNLTVTIDSAVSTTTYVLSLSLSLYIYICVCIKIYIYIYIEREREICLSPPCCYSTMPEHNQYVRRRHPPLLWQCHAAYAAP